jgi:HlyD family secretion protein
MKKKYFFIIGAVLLILIIVVLNIVQTDKGQDVEVKIVDYGDIVSEVTASGELRAKAQVDISSETIGRIKKIFFREGDYVKKGALLIELDDVQVRASLKLARAQLDQAEQELSRAEKLFEKELISKESYEKIVLSYETTKARYEQALDAFEKTKIYAPISGKIMKLNVEEGETAVMGTMNYEGTVLMTVADMSMMIAVVTIDETDVPSVALDQKVEVIADALPDSVYTGRVTKVGLMPITSQLTTEKVTDFEVEIELNEFSDLLRPGMNVKTEITTNKKSSVLIIPIQASGKRKIKEKMVESVFIVSDNKAVLQEIVTGVSSDTDIEVISGIEKGDTVIVGPYRVLSKLEDGQQVKFQIEPEDSVSSEVMQTSFKPRRVVRVLKKGI